ncbi:hypothetical protein [Kitasatospora purpeofusca]|uniref:hypothetical protein n=1 Tax=Kitasatospora purpeofusca TaxID=67352 RepID=UPI00386A9611|nr:hypothetical protein OIP63_10005 [Kitasatospora purpeofusca]
MTTTAATSGPTRAKTEEPTVLLPEDDCPGGDIERAAIKAGILAAPEDGGPCVWIDLGDTGMSSSYMRDADRVRKFASDLRVFATAVDTIAAELAKLQE